MVYDTRRSVTLEINTERKCFIDNLLDRIHFIIVMIRWTGLAPGATDPPWDTACPPLPRSIQG